MSAFHLVVPPNPHGRDFVVGDLHGYLGALQDALARAGFDPGRDRLFSTGDLCTRMPWAIIVEHRSGRRFGICHAQCPVADWGDIASVARDEKLQQEMLWARSRITRTHAPPAGGIDCTIHGHTVVRAALRRGNALFIDTGIFLPGERLTLLSLDET